jgi:ABC-type multidrug transport system ATPase subunit
VIVVSGLTKRFGQTSELAGVDLSIARGECVAVVGAAGGGRTALMRVLATFVPPSSGRITIGGLDVVSDLYRVRQCIAYAGAAPVPPNRLRVVEYLRLVTGARLQPSSAANVAADLVGLNAEAPIETLGDGLRQRLPLAAALATAADVLLLDDAFRNLGGADRDRVSEWLIGACERGTTIIVAAGEDDVPEWCQRTVRLHAGRIVELATAAGDPPHRSPELVGA